MRLSGGDVDVTAGTAFRKGEPIPLVRLTVESEGQSVVVWVRPLEARAIGLDLIGAVHASLADCELRTIAKDHGFDGDAMIGGLRKRTTAELGPG